MSMRLLRQPARVEMDGLLCSFVTAFARIPRSQAWAGKKSARCCFTGMRLARFHCLVILCWGMTVGKENEPSSKETPMDNPRPFSRKDYIVFLLILVASICLFATLPLLVLIDGFAPVPTSMVMTVRNLRCHRVRCSEIGRAHV